MLITFVTTLAGLGFGLWRGEPLLYAVLGLLLGRVLALDVRLRDLQRRLPPSTKSPEAVRPTSAAAPTSSSTPAAPAPNAEPVSPPATPPAATPQTAAPDETATQTADQPAGERWLESLRDWLLGGNLFVRVGILLVFLGVGFLIKHAVDQEWLTFTLELRLIAVATAALALLALGWLLRRKRRDYGLLLQGAAVGILYLDVYGAYQLAQLLPQGPALGLLALIGIVTAALAVAQNAPSLAWFGFAGGFLAPVATASGSDDPVALFGYYALLNAAILAVAWLKSWRALNLLGFGFTFGVALVWSALDYAPNRFLSVEPFLVLFLLFYVAIPVLYAVRQPPRLRGYVDATLVFGTPILAFAVQVELVRHFEHGIGWSAGLAGAFYLALAGSLFRLGGTGFKLLAEAFLALGVIFLSMAIPFALASDTTAGAWALEGAGLVWIGGRQRHHLTRALGLLLQAGAAVSLIAGLPYVPGHAFANSAYLGTAMIAFAGLTSAYWLDRPDIDRHGWERGGAFWLILWGLAWWLGGGVVELLQLDPHAGFPAHWLWYAVLTGALAEAGARLAPWPRLHPIEGALTLLGLVALAASVGRLSHPSLAGGLAAWPAFFALGYLVLHQVEQRDRRPYLAWCHAALTLLLAAVLEWELVWLAHDWPALGDGWKVASVALVPLVGLTASTVFRTWPQTAWPLAYGAGVGGVMVFALVLWALWSTGSAGGAAPLPWLPIFDPLDGTLALALLAIWRWRTDLERRAVIQPTLGEADFFRIGFGLLAFLWINLVLLRGLHRLWSIPYRWESLFQSDAVQTSISLLWGLVGVGLLLLARARVSRPIWIAGATVLAAVVIKLFAVDLDASGTLERIVSFLAVGGLMVGIGWWSPLPPNRGSRPDDPR